MAPSPTPTQAPTETPSVSPTLAPTLSPTISHQPTGSPRPTSTEYDRLETRSDTGEAVFLTQCGWSTDDLPANAGTLTDQVITFDYEMTLSDAAVDPGSQIAWLEERLNAVLSRRYLGECEYPMQMEISGSNSTLSFQTFSLSSLPTDTVGPRCADGTANCYTLNGALTAQLFYLLQQRKQRRHLQETTLSDLVVAESFGGALTEVLEDPDFLAGSSSSGSDNIFAQDDHRITKLKFLAITNFVAQDGTTFGGVDPDSSGAAGVTGERTQAAAEPNNGDLAWAATFLGAAVVSLVVVAFFVVRRRRRRASKKEALERTHLQDNSTSRVLNNSSNVPDNDLFTYEDEEASGVRAAIAAAIVVGADDDGVGSEGISDIYSLDAGADVDEPPEGSDFARQSSYVVDDYMADTGGSVESSQFAGIEVAPAPPFFSRENTNPPVFVSTNNNEPDYHRASRRAMDDLMNGARYDPYGSSKDNTPDTLDL